MPNHPIVSHDEWIAARKALLLKEKEETRLRDAVNAARLALPWERVEKAYRFQTGEGEKAFGDLFDGRRQLIVYHFMLAPGADAGCVGCSFLSDHVAGMLPHLLNHDVTFVAVSRAPLAEIEAYKARMGWTFPWVSSEGSDFNQDFDVSFTADQIAAGGATYNYEPVSAGTEMEDAHGLSAFWRDPDGALFHTYSSYARGNEIVAGTLLLLDRAPLGRNEGSTMDFVRRHDEYDAPPAAACCHGAAA